jgi:hypothetical protein
MFNEKILEEFISRNDPLCQICTKEYILGVLQFGSFLSMVHNKRLNPSAIFCSILEDKNLRDIFVEITHSDNVKEALLGILQLYPPLLKSKNTKRLFKKSITQKSDRTRKKNIQ